MCLNDRIDFNFEAGGIYEDCVFPDKVDDHWGWYIGPGVRICIANYAELYGKVHYTNIEGYDVWRFDAGLLFPITECLSFKVAGFYEDRFEKESLLVGVRFNY